MLRAPSHLLLSAASALIAGAATCAVACALPHDPLTGIEISWSLDEREESDGESALRPRTCSGALLQRVAIAIEDLEAPSRSRTFEYRCAAGLQTSDSFATLPSDIYVDLRPSTYRVVAYGRPTGPAGAEPEVVIVAAENLTIPESGVSRLHIDLAPPLIPWTLETQGTERCTAAAAIVRYANPAADLALPEAAPGEANDASEDGEQGELLEPENPYTRYRTSLRGDGGLVLDGAPQPCTAWASPQTFLVDPGRYILEVTVDDDTCPIAITIPPSGATTPLDLAKLPCPG